MSTLAKAKKVAAKFGGKIEVGTYDPSMYGYAVQALAPDHKKWCDGPQILIEWKFTYVKGSAKEAYDHLIERMELGVEPMTEEDY